MPTYAVIDFETTGLSPDHGARPTEIGVVLLSDGRIVDRYQSLMNAGARIPAEIVALTGITNEMVKKARSVDLVMREAAEFVGDTPLAAHNASFDQKFWDAELARLRKKRQHEFTCSLLLSRRVFPHLSSHRLGSLTVDLDLPKTGRSHRALADAESAAYLLSSIQKELMRRYALPYVTYEMLIKVQRAAKAKLDACVAQFEVGVEAAV